MTTGQTELEPAAPPPPPREAPLRHEPHWPAVVAVLGALVLYGTLPERFTVGPSWAIPALEFLLLLPLALVRPSRSAEQSQRRRQLALVLTALLSVANAVSLGLLVHYLLHGQTTDGTLLVKSSIEIWLTNVVVFALWYWELDRGGPSARCLPDCREPDFLFPQMTSPQHAPREWRPGFVDYFYVSFTNSTAFSPTDTMPLTTWAKLLMGFQSAISLLTVVLVASRAVNILH